MKKKSLIVLVVAVLLVLSALTIYKKSKAMINISIKTQSSLELLTRWGEGEQVYSLYNFRDMELHGSFEKCDLAEEWFGDSFRENGYDFLEFGYTRAGDLFALWIYPELKGEPPVVLLDSDGEVELLAPSLTDFLCLLTDEQSISSEVEDGRTSWYKIYKHQYKEISDENVFFENSEKVEIKIKLEMKSLRSKISKIQECRSVSNIIKDFKRHPNFKKWFEDNFVL